MLLSLCDDCYCCCSLARFCTSWSVLSAISHRSRLSISLQSLRWLRQTNMRVMKIHIDFYLMCSVIVYTKTHTDYVHLFCFKNGKMKQFEPNESAAKAAARKRIPHTHTPNIRRRRRKMIEAPNALIGITALYIHRTFCSVTLNRSDSKFGRESERKRVLRCLVRLMKLLHNDETRWLYVVCGHRRLSIRHTHIHTIHLAVCVCVREIISSGNK